MEKPKDMESTNQKKKNMKGSGNRIKDTEKVRKDILTKKGNILGNL